MIKGICWATDGAAIRSMPVTELGPIGTRCGYVLSRPILDLDSGVYLSGASFCDGKLSRDEGNGTNILYVEHADIHVSVCQASVGAEARGPAAF